MYRAIPTIQNAELNNKIVVVCANYDVMVKNDEIVDNTRVQASLETILFLLEKNCKIVLISDFGDPKGEEKDDLSLMPVRFELGKLLSKPIKFAHIDACENSIKFMENGEILLLENLKFNPEEESSNESKRKGFMSTLARLGNVFINDAFGVSEKLASISELSKSLPTFYGFHFLKELEAAKTLMESAEKPYTGIFGGIPSEKKFKLMKKLSKDLNFMLIGGPLAYVFLKAKKISVGSSNCPNEFVKEAKNIIDAAKKNKCEIVLPVDHICATELKESSKPIEVDTQQIPKELLGLDIGEKTLIMFREKIEASQTILWHGPMGQFEWDNFNRGTEAIGEYIALSAPKQAYKYAFGCHTSLAINTLKIKKKRFNHISIDSNWAADLLIGKKIKSLDKYTK